MSSPRKPSTLERRLKNAIEVALADNSGAYHWVEAREGKLRFRYLPIEGAIEVSVLEIYPTYQKIARSVVDTIARAPVSSVVLASLHKAHWLDRVKRYRFPGRRARILLDESDKSFITIEYIQEG